MSPRDLMQLLTASMIRHAAQDFASQAIDHRFHDSERYDLLIDGNRYPPKAIVGIATRSIPGGRILEPGEFAGGLGSTCFRCLEKLGFAIVRKTEVTYESNFLQVGATYRRREIHQRFGGQERGGIATPTAHDVILIFSGEQGDAYGYKDEFRADDGVFLYTGEGQVGDMKMAKGNAAIRDAASQGKRILLFKTVARGEVSFQGEVEYIGHFETTRPDREGNMRKAIVFELTLVPLDGSTAAAEEEGESLSDSLDGQSLARLRALALKAASKSAPLQEKRRINRTRSEAVKAYVLKRAGGVCEGCNCEAPFVTIRGTPYLEPHHTTRLADEGPDHPANVIALCPTCHRRSHHAKDFEAFNASLKDRLKTLEPD